MQPCEPFAAIPARTLSIVDMRTPRVDTLQQKFSYAQGIGGQS